MLVRHSSPPAGVTRLATVRPAPSNRLCPCDGTRGVAGGEQRGGRGGGVVVRVVALDRPAGGVVEGVGDDAPAGRDRGRVLLLARAQQRVVQGVGGDLVPS